MKILKEILQELILIRKELQAIRSSLEFEDKMITIDGAKISHQLGELHMKRARSE